MFTRRFVLKVTCVLSSFVSTLVFAHASRAVTTTYNGGSNIFAGASWDMGAPNAANDGLVNIDGTITTAGGGGFGDGSVVNQVAGNLSFGSTVFNMTSGTWNLSGGSMTFTNQWTPNDNNPAAPVTTFNISGGTLTSTGNVNGPLNFALVTVSETGVVDLAQFFGGAAGTIDFLSGWSGTFTNNAFTGNDWQDLFTGDDGNANFGATFNGAVIDATTFNSTFLVTNGGATLSLITPEPSTLALSTLSLLALGLPLNRRRRNLRG